LTSNFCSIFFFKKNKHIPHPKKMNGNDDTNCTHGRITSYYVTHGNYYDCECIYGYGTMDCSVSLAEKIGSLYEIRWLFVSLSFLVVAYTLFRLCFKLQTRGKNIKMLILGMISSTMILNGIHLIDPFCQIIFSQDMRNAFSILSVINALVSMMMMIRLLASTYVKFQPSKRLSAKILDIFFITCAILFCSISIVWISASPSVSIDTRYLFGLIYSILAFVFVVILNIGGCVYISNTLGHVVNVAVVAPPIKTTPVNSPTSIDVNNSEVKVLRIIIEPASPSEKNNHSPQLDYFDKLKQDKLQVRNNNFFNYEIRPSPRISPRQSQQKGSRGSSNNNNSTDYQLNGKDRVKIAANKLLKAMRGVQITSTIGIALFLCLSFFDPLRHNLVLQFTVELCFRLLIIVSCFFVSRSMTSNHRKIIDNKKITPLEVMESPPQSPNPDIF
jgi:hypothetical protein